MAIPRSRILFGIIVAAAMLMAACGDADSGLEATASGDQTAAPDAPATADDSAETGDATGAENDASDAAVESSEADVDAGDTSWPHTFVADDVDGALFDANDLAGQDVVLWFWAPW